MQNVLVPPWAPTHYAGKRIVSRWPYDMPGELVVPNTQTGQPFPDATFLSNLDKPMEVWGVHVEIDPLVEGGTPDHPVDPNPVLVAGFQSQLARLVKLGLTYVSLDQKISKAKERVSTMVDRNTGSWLWAPAPNTIGRAQGYVVEVDNVAPATIATGVVNGIAGVTITQLRIVVRFFGFLLVLEGAKTNEMPGPTLPPTG